MHAKILATVLFLLICIVPGSKAGFFNGLPLSAPELVMTAVILAGIFGTPWNKSAIIQKLVIVSLSLLLVGQVVAKNFLPVGWNVCLRTSAGAPQGNSVCERSLEFPRGEKSFIYETIDFSKENLPLYFLNDTSRFNFLQANNEPNRNKLPFSINASTFFHAREGDFLLVRSDKNIALEINGAPVFFKTNEKASLQKIALTPNALNHIELTYETNRSKKNTLVAQLPRTSFLEIDHGKSLPNTVWVTLYTFINTSLFILLILTFTWTKEQELFFLKKSQKIILSFGALGLILFWVLVSKDFIGFKESLFPFSIFLIVSSLLFIFSENSSKKTFLPLIFLTLFLNSCIFATTRALPEEAIIFDGGNDPLGHEWFARRIFLSPTAEEFKANVIGTTVDYYQPLHQYFLALFHVISGENMWGSYTIQTFLFSLAIFSCIVVLQNISALPAIIFSIAMVVLLAYEPTSAMEVILSPLQQAIALPFIILSFAILLSFLTQQQEVKQKKRIWMFFLLGLSFGAGSMIRTDWLPAFSGILLGIISLFFLKSTPQKDTSVQPKIMKRFFFSLSFYKVGFLFFFIGLFIFPFLLGYKNFVFVGKFTFLPTSGFVNLLPEIKSAVGDNINYYENSTTVFLKEVARGFSNRYDELAEILLKNIYVDIIRPTVVRVAFWILSGIIVIFSIFIFVRMRKTNLSSYIALGSVLFSFLTLIGIGSFFGQHNGIAMIAIYDILIAIMLSIGAFLLSERFEITGKIGKIFSKKASSFQRNKLLSTVLLSKTPKNAGFLDKIKIGYRPYVCPFSELLDIIPENTSVFDIGCGNGMFLFLVSKFKCPKALGGIEISKNLIQNATEILESPEVNRENKISLHVFDGQTIPKEICFYENIFMIDVLHHIPKTDQMKFLATVSTHMSIGSKLILKDIDEDRFLLSKFNKLHDLLFSGEIGHELSSNFVLKKLAQMGLKVHSLHKKRMFLYPHYTIVCEKI